jgi:hypothetical protein
MEPGSRRFHNESMTQLGQSNFDDAPDSLTMGQHDAVAAINSANADFWAKRAADEARQGLLR